MAEPTIFKCKDNTYIISDWDVEKALENMVWITKTFGESILNLFVSAEALDAIDAVKSGEEISGELQGKAEDFMSKLLMNLDPKDYVSRTKQMIQGTLCNAKEIDYNTHFRGKIGELHSVLFAILKHQYSDFLGGSTGSPGG